MFLRVVAEKGYKLEVTEAHMVVTQGGKVIPAALVKVGDMLVTASEGAVAVKEVHTVRRRGQYAPFTPSGLDVCASVGVLGRRTNQALGALPTSW